MISLCMIVKDEEARIEQCLLSVKDYVNEMIVIDTGSTDNTIGICERHGAVVYPYVWEENFSAARNFGLQLCQCKWILWMDADEALDESSAKLLPKIIAETKAKVIALPIFNYYGESEKINEDDYYLLYQPRLFQNFLGFTFENRVHETLNFPEDFSDEDVQKVNIPIHHYGYTEDIINEKNKSVRNISILRDELSDPNHSPWIEYHLASELYRIKEYETAFRLVNHSIMLFLKEKVYPPSLLYKLKYEILIETENWDGAWPSIDKALVLYPDYVDLHYYKGIIMLKLNQYKEAFAAFEKCLELGDTKSDYLVLNGVGSFKAQKYRNLCLNLINESGEQS